MVCTKQGGPATAKGVVAIEGREPTSPAMDLETYKATILSAIRNMKDVLEHKIKAVVIDMGLLRVDYTEQAERVTDVESTMARLHPSVADHEERLARLQKEWIHGLAIPTWPSGICNIQASTVGQPGAMTSVTPVVLTTYSWPRWEVKDMFSFREDVSGMPKLDVVTEQERGWYREEFGGGDRDIKYEELGGRQTEPWTQTPLCMSSCLEEQEDPVACIAAA
ncbi:hypothetical protein NDU88_004823 [Pleurodeles waltl]|uniref:Uncharacterized protein n=1 Tax=Pleurodeles waltl TaxID=8319 RepID=A0AAV7NNF2_PLEWA|nr:hypothetical protein NDU88_004823 [Pleurodeles waltl]